MAVRFRSEPTVALESSVIAQGLPRPFNLEAAHRVEDAVRSAGATPRTTAFVNGRPTAGIDRATLERLATTDGVPKASMRDLPVVSARGLLAATTVSTTAWIAARSGIRVMATGGIGGVHRDPAGRSLDVSSDLPALASLPITVVCSGPKSLLDLEATREWLETHGVTILGFGTAAMPAFWYADSGLRADARCDSVAEIADVVRARDREGLTTAILVCVPVPDGHGFDRDRLEPEIETAIREAHEDGITGGAVTPRVLARLRERVGDGLLHANIALLERNASIAGALAVELAPSTARRA